MGRSACAALAMAKLAPGGWDARRDIHSHSSKIWENNVDGVIRICESAEINVDVFCLPEAVGMLL